VRFFLFDRVVEVERGRRMVAVKTVGLMDGYLEDHFPREAVLPATSLIEALAQAAGMLNSFNHAFAVEMVLMLVDGVELHRPIHAGEVLTLEVTMIYDHPYGATLRAEARAEAEVVAIAERIVFAHEVTEDPVKIGRARERFRYQAGLPRKSPVTQP
jgi:3-hydroxyacyl-[acyl-carrier-protein] dehydratase